MHIDSDIRDVGTEEEELSERFIKERVLRNPSEKKEVGTLWWEEVEGEQKAESKGSGLP